MARRPSAARAASVASPPPVARLAANQLKRMRRIVDAAVDLAETGGFEAVRLRDVANRSDVALGTLYKYFRSKEDLLLYALHEEIARLESDIMARPAEGRSALGRVTDLFRRATLGLTRRPQFARAAVRALAVGDPETAIKVAGLQLRMSRLIVAALRAEPPDLAAPLDGNGGTARERQVATSLILVWFSAQIGWAVGLQPLETVTEHVRNTARLMLNGGKNE